MRSLPSRFVLGILALVLPGIPLVILVLLIFVFVFACRFRLLRCALTLFCVFFVIFLPLFLALLLILFVRLGLGSVLIQIALFLRFLAFLFFCPCSGLRAHHPTSSQLARVLARARALERVLERVQVQARVRVRAPRCP